MKLSYRAFCENANFFKFYSFKLNLRKLILSFHIKTKKKERKEWSYKALDKGAPLKERTKCTLCSAILRHFAWLCRFSPFQTLFTLGEFNPQIRFLTQILCSIYAKIYKKHKASKKFKTRLKNAYR